MPTLLGHLQPAAWAHSRTWATDPGAESELGVAARSGSSRRRRRRAPARRRRQRWPAGTSPRRSHSPGGSAPRRSARSGPAGRTPRPTPAGPRCRWRPSSPAACRSSVDLPMPGSPPTSVTEPGTSPPPAPGRARPAPSPSAPPPPCRRRRSAAVPPPRVRRSPPDAPCPPPPSPRPTCSRRRTTGTARSTGARRSHTRYSDERSGRAPSHGTLPSGCDRAGDAGVPEPQVVWTMRMLEVAWWLTLLGTDPMRKRLTPAMPLLPITSRS